jgi:hypothetical protein
MVFGVFTSVALLLLSRRVFMGQFRLLPLFALVAGLELVGGILTFSKLEALLAVIFIGIGAYLARPTRKMAVSFLVLAVIGYVWLIPLVQYGRQAIGVSANVAKREQAAISFVTGRPIGVASQEDEGIQEWWARLSYAPVQAFVMDAYDIGDRGTSLLAVPMALIPRFLWPGKPVMTTGAQLTYLINGNSQSQSSPTSFGEGYWNGGWLLALGVAAWMGVVFRFFQTSCLDQIAEGNFGVLPFVALGVLMGLRPDDWFGLTYLGGFAIAVVVYVSCLVLARELRGGK